MAIVKCRNCGKQVDRDLAIAISKKCYVCSEECKNKYIEKKHPKPKDNKNDRLELIDYLDKNATGEVNFPKETAYLTKLLKANPDFTFKGIQYTLWYLIHIEKKKINGFGLVPYYYEKAKKYYDKLQRIKSETKTIDIKQDERIVIVRTNKYINKDIFD